MCDAINIAVAPLKTEFHFQEEELVFALIFPALPSNVRMFSIIESEDSNWKFRNISRNCKMSIVIKYYDYEK